MGTLTLVISLIAALCFAGIAAKNKTVTAATTAAGVTTSGSATTSAGAQTSGNATTSAGSTTSADVTTSGNATTSAGVTTSGNTTTSAGVTTSGNATTSAGVTTSGNATTSAGVTTTAAITSAAVTTTATPDACAPNPCINGTCVNNVANYTCNCDAGFTGQTCSTNVVECANNPCMYNGTCTDQVNGYSCACVNYTSGANCETLAHFFTEWTAWGACNRECGDPIQNRTRTCTDVSGASRTECPGSSFQEQVCPGRPACPCAVFLCSNPNICGNTVTKKLHQCLDTTCGVFECLCASGYVANSAKTNCIDEDECMSANNLCGVSGSYATGVSGCENTEGDYRCTCMAGYTYNTATKACEDIDECATNAANCDVSPRASCTNTVGSFTCTCVAPYAGNGVSCLEDRLIAFSSHTKVGNADMFTPYINTPEALPLSGSFAPVVYATKSGVVLLVGVASSATTERRKTLDNPSSVALNTIAFPSEFKESALIAAYWASMAVVDTSDATRGLYYHTYERTSSSSAGDLAVLATVGGLANFTAEYAAVFTWNKMGDVSNDLSTITFQCIIASDYKNTVAITIYGDRAMGWHKTLSAGGVRNFQARVGVTGFTSGTSSEYQYSYLDIAVNSDQTLISRMDAQTQSGMTSAGRFVYSLSSNPTSFVHPGIKCRDWIALDVALDTSLGSSFTAPSSDTVPSASGQMDAAFFDAISDASIPAGVSCYRQNTPFYTSGDEFYTVRACYIGTALVEVGDEAGFFNTYQRFNGSKEATDLEAAGYCCSTVNIDSFASNDALCSQFYTRRPIVTSTGFISKGQSSSVGDPHITTLDGKAYSFNGHGEYILCKLPSVIEVQGRTTFVMKNGTAQGATIFSSIAGKQSSPASDAVEFRLNSTGTGVDVYKNQVLQAGVGQEIESSTVAYNNVRLLSLKKGSNIVYTMAFSTGMSVQVTVVFDLMLVSIIAPGNWAGNLTGMMGNFDGDMSNDFAYPNGTALATGVNSTEEELYSWGQGWRFASSKDSLFYYDTGNGESWSSFDKDTFVPVFFNANLTIMFPESAKLQAAYDTCNSGKVDTDPAANRECYFDLKVTDSRAAGASAAASKAGFAAQKQALANYAPTISGNVTLEVTAGSSYASLLTIDATDKNGDTIYFILNSGAPARLSVDNNTKVLSWNNVQYTANASVQITASDGSAGTLWTPKVEMCNCQNGGTCDFSVSSLSSYLVVPCICSPGYEGPFCGTDIDGCADNPCFTLCTDVPASTFATNGGIAFQCDPCPTGLAGNGQYCADQDECLENIDGCAQNCQNLPGSFECSCIAGYNLQADLKACADVDECAHINECTAGTALCVASSSDCVNTMGDYTCVCKAGYSMSYDCRTCEDINECTNSTLNSCALGCLNTVGSYICTCPTGYNLANDGFTCTNINECASDVTNDCDTTFGICTDTTPGYTCSCQAGYTGDGFLCIDLNECAQANRGGCSQGCSNKVGGFDCYCGNGYTANATYCNDVNECLSDSENGCYSSQYCTNTDGGYTCSCPSGFTLKSNGRTCESIFKCASNSTCSHTCARVNSTDICQCPSGMERDASQVNCTDINECASSSTKLCSADNNVVCVNTASGYRCDCSNNTLYTQVEERKCIDKDECALGTFSCGANSRCQNANPGYTCVCDTGYYDNAGTCVDTDECALGSDSCDATLGVCTNTAPEYTCACKAGYEGDGITCSDINECATGTAQCDSRSSRSTCTNTAGSYTCNCTAGYKLASNGLTCNDIDECSLNTDGCQHTCNNQDGSFSCSCFNGYRLDLDQKSCVVEFECAAYYSSRCAFSCALLNGNDTCSCPTGKTLNADGFACDDINECLTSPCDPARGLCTNTDGSYTCACNDSYTLGPGNTCNDRDGNWGVWGNYSSCTQTCGGGTRSRSRACNNPSKVGAGADCPGNANETISCNTNVCPLSQAAETYGVSVKLGGGMTTALFNTVTDQFKQAVADGTNTYCNYNSTQWSQCCPHSNSSHTPNANNPLSYTKSSLIDIAANYPLQIAVGKIEVVLVLKAEGNNALCSAGSSSRRKRAVSIGGSQFALPQTVLNGILSNTATQTQLVTAVQNNLPAGSNIIITLESVGIAVQPTTAVPTTTTVAQATQPAGSGTTAAPALTTTVGATATPAGTEAWVIAVGVVGGLVGVVIIIVIIVLVKRPSKVGSGDVTA